MSTYQTFVEKYPSGYSVRVKFGKENRFVKTSSEMAESKEKSVAFAKRLAEKNKGSYEGFLDMNIKKQPMNKVKDYSYIKRSDISVLKATIDGKVLDVDPKTILSGTYVAGKVKSTASNLRVAKTNPATIREKLLKKYKDFAEDEYNSDFEKYVNVEDIKKFVECGLTEEMIMAFYGGIECVMDIKADNEFAYNPIGGVFSFRTDMDGQYVKNWVKRGLYNCENNVYELGFKYPEFNWSFLKRTDNTEVISTEPYDYFGKKRIDRVKIEKFVVNAKFTVIACKSAGYIEDGVASKYSDDKLNAGTPLELNGDYLALVSRNSKELFELAKRLLNQPKGYVKDFDWLVQSKTSGAEQLTNANYKFKRGGQIEVNNETTNFLVGDEVYRVGDNPANSFGIVKSIGSTKVYVTKHSDSKVVPILPNKLYRGSQWQQVNTKNSYADGGGIGYSSMDRYDRIRYFMNNFGFEVDDIQETDTSVGIFGGWVIYKKRNDKKEIYYSISYDDLWYYVNHNGTKADVVKDSTIVDDDFFEQGGSTYLKGGRIDLFEDYENIPPKIQSILDKYSEDIEDGNYDGLEKALKEVEFEGYTFEYYLDGVVYGLRPIGVRLNELQGYEDEDYAKGGSTYQGGGKVDFSYSEIYQEWVKKTKNKTTSEISILSRELAKKYNLSMGEYFDILQKYGNGGSIDKFDAIKNAPITYTLYQGEKVFLTTKSFNKAVDTRTTEKFKGNFLTLEMKDSKNNIRTVKFEKGGGIEDDYMSYARSNAKDKIDWNEEVRNYAGEYYDSLTEEEKGSIIAEMQMNWDYHHSFAKGGVLSEANYIPREEILKVELKNGKIIENSWGSPIYSGLRVGKGITEREEMETQGQTTLFKKGGTMPKFSKYISQREIAKVFIGDEDNPKEISGRDLIGGVWFDNKKTEELIISARKRGLIK